MHTAFNDLVSSPSVRGLLASISGESLVPSSSLTSTSSSFTDDLSQLQNLLKPNEAAYILLKQEHGAPDGFVAVTYVPNSAPVRQKMLFASTRLTLVRELGVERFRETIFCTEKEELTKEGWRRHEQHTKLAAPLTEEEEGLRGVKEAEAAESGGTGGRKRVGGGGIELGLEEGLVDAIRSVGEGPEGGCVQVVSGS